MAARDIRMTLGATRSSPATPARNYHDGREVRGMLNALEQLGYDLDRLLASAGLHRSDVEDPEAYLSPNACALVFAHAQQEKLVKNLALQLALRTPVGTTPLLDYLIVSSDSVRQGLHRLARYLRLVNPNIHLTVKDDQNPVHVVLEKVSTSFEAELTVSLSVLRFTHETDDRLRASHASFTHKPDDIVEYARVLKCPVRAGSSWNGWALPHSAMDLPLRRRDPALGQWLDRRAAEMLARLPVSGDVRDEVFRALSTQLAAGELSVQAVARRLATTERTLQRRLAASGTCFEDLRDEIRRKAAETYLMDSTLSTTEIAYLLGFSEPTAFHRAFKRWHNRTPQTFRAQLKPS